LKFIGLNQSKSHNNDCQSAGKQQGGLHFFSTKNTKRKWKGEMKVEEEKKEGRKER
jgi:hypothetical protein